MVRKEDESSQVVYSHPTCSTFLPSLSESIIRNGVVSGFLPNAEVIAVHYPGYPSSPARAIKTLGGLPKIAIAWRCALQNQDDTYDYDKDGKRFLRLRFRPEDPYCHPTFGEPHSSTSLLLKISRTQNVNTNNDKGAVLEQDDSLSANIVARVSLAYQFEGMMDYQHVVAIHAAESCRKKRPRDSNDELFLNDGNMNLDSGDIMMLVPQLFSRKDKPEKIVLNPPAYLASEIIHKAVVEYSWEMNIEPCHAIPFNIDKIPERIIWEDKLPNDTSEWEAQMAVSKLFDERPIWPRWSLHERLLDDGQEVSEYLLRKLLFRTGYYFSSGPFGRFWIRKGYNPRENPDSRVYQKVDFRIPLNLRNLKDVNTDFNVRAKQKWKDICKFKVWPSKASNCLQLFELDDKYIHQEIEKPAIMTTCSPLTGWFSETLLKALRLHVMIRFLEVTPKGPPEEFLKSKIDDFKRCIEKEALSKFWKFEKHDNQDANHYQVQNSKPNDFEREVQNKIHQLEEEEEEEEDEEEFGYEDDKPPYTIPYEMVEGIPNEYLQELLSGFAYGQNDQNQQTSDVKRSGSNDDEYQIYEQDSESEDDYL